MRRPPALLALVALLLAVPGAALGVRPDGRLSVTYASGAALARFAAANQARIVRQCAP
jgi:hypothetical protein